MMKTPSTNSRRSDANIDRCPETANICQWSLNRGDQLASSFVSSPHRCQAAASTAHWQSAKSIVTRFRHPLPTTCSALDGSSNSAWKSATFGSNDKWLWLVVRLRAFDDKDLIIVISDGIRFQSFHRSMNSIVRCVMEKWDLA